MEEELVIENKPNKLRITLITLLSVIFLFMSFSFTSAFYVTFVLGLLALAISIYLAKDHIKQVDKLSLLIYLIPVIALGTIYAISNFSNQYYDVATRVLIPISFLVFSFIGVSLHHVSKIELKYLFLGLFAGIAAITIINLIFTLYHYGPFYGIRYGSYLLYYDGDEGRDSLASVASALVGFSIKEVPIQYYVIFPSLLLSSATFYLLNDRKCKKNIIISSFMFLLALISFIFVISRTTLYIFIIVLLIQAAIALIILFKIKFNKVLKIASLVILGLLVLAFIFTFLNAQSNLHIFDWIKENSFLNYLANSNRYMVRQNVLLNGIFSKDKVIGFPLMFDEAYEAICYPSLNIFTNQFMYGGVFGFIFFILLAVIITNNFLKVRKIEMNEFNKIMPFVFIVSFVIYSLISDVSNIEFFNFSKFVATPTNPFFLLVILWGGYYNSLAAKGGTYDEE